MTKDDNVVGTIGMRDSSAINAVSALLDERRQYESWIAALDARRAATPEHVFLRVHADYSARLDAVSARLATHADALHREVADLSARLVALEEEHRQATDERAEAELRAHVGELSADAWERTSSGIDARLGDMSGRREILERDLERTKELHAGAVGAAASVVAAPAVAEALPEAKPLHIDLEEVRQMDDVPPIDDVAVPLEILGDDLVDEPPPASSGQSPEPREPSAPVGEEMPDPVAAPAPVSPLTSRPSRGSSPGVGGFDELAFLSSVVDTPAGSIDPAPRDEPDERTRRSTFASRASEEPIIRAAPDITPPRQLAAIEYERAEESLINPDPPANGSRTLRCKCGALNLPTDWYCDSCGNELVTL